MRSSTLRLSFKYQTSSVVWEHSWNFPRAEEGEQRLQHFLLFPPQAPSCPALKWAREGHRQPGEGQREVGTGQNCKVNPAQAAGTFGLIARQGDNQD